MGAPALSEQDQVCVYSPGLIALLQERELTGAGHGGGGRGRPGNIQGRTPVPTGNGGAEPSVIHRCNHSLNGRWGMCGNTGAHGMLLECQKLCLYQHLLFWAIFI